MRCKGLAGTLIGLVLCVLVGCGGSDEAGTSASGGGPEDATAVVANNRGVALMGQYDYGQAFEIFSNLSQQYPDWTDVLVNREIARLNRQQEGDEVQALSELQDISTSNPDHLRALYTASMLQYYLDEPKKAKAGFLAVLKADPTDAHAAYYAGQCAAQEGNMEEALGFYEKAMSIDPYLRSAVYGASQSLRRLGRIDESTHLLDLFQQLEDNPRAHLAEIKYTRMGPKAMAVVAGVELDGVATRPPDGPIFASPVTVESPTDFLAGASLTACDFDGDGDVDVLATGLSSDFRSQLFRNQDGQLAPESDHPLSAISGVQTVLWGDVNDDGFVDAYLCRTGVNQLWFQGENDVWVSSPDPSVGGGDLRTVDGALFDADHDGDLDIFCVNADGPNELLNNNRNGTFRPLGEEGGVGGTSMSSRQVLVADLDRDRDVDIIVINDAPPHDVYINDRLWTWTPGSAAFDEIMQAEILAAVAGDLDSDGRMTIVTTNGQGVQLWNQDHGAGSNWAPSSVSIGEDLKTDRLALLDADGDGSLDLITAGDAGWTLWSTTPAQSRLQQTRVSSLDSVPILLEPGRGPAYVLLGTEGLHVQPAGPGRYPFVTVTFSGRTDAGQSMRSNASGIGTSVAVRRGSRWTVTGTLRMDSGPGQSLQPLSLGLGTSRTIDFIAVDWSDGVFQTELDLDGSGVHEIVETQRQLSSCPILFAWDGSGFGFVSDCLGVGGIGFALGRDAWSTPRPWERFLLPEGSLKARGSEQEATYDLMIAEPMEEICYLDSVTLESWDLPPGWNMTIDERMATGGPPPTGSTIFHRRSVLPQLAMRSDGLDVTGDLQEMDLLPVDPGDLDLRFIGRLRVPLDLMLEFPVPIDDGLGEPVLVLDGWVEYPYSQTMFAAWQAGATYNAPTLLAEDAAGNWVQVLPKFGYPAGMPRQMALPLPELPEGCRRLRLVTDLQVYWDRIQIVYSEPCPSARRTVRELVRAEVLTPGYPRRTTGLEYQPSYAWSERVPLSDMRAQRGFYTAAGSAEELVTVTDDALAIIGTGDAIHLQWSLESNTLPDQWTRRHVLDIRGWCKDMDLATRDGEQVEPLPVRSHSSPEADRDHLHTRYNTRYRSGW